MKNNNHIFLLLSVTILFIFIAIANTQLLSFSLNPAYSTTQQEDESSQEDADSEQSENGINNTEAVDSVDQPQAQQPSQIDMISPNVLSVTPNVGTSGIPVTTTIIAIFSEPVDASTVTPTTFTLETDNNKVHGSTSLSSDATTAIFTPSSALSGSTIYTASISEVKDLAGNTMNFASPWSFTTEAQASPSPPQQPTPSNPSTPSNPGGGGSSGGSTGGGVLGDIKTSPTEKDVLKDAAQYVEDEKMVDRILPIIFDKMDKRQLASLILPYLDLQVTVRQANGETKEANGDTARAIVTTGTCGSDEILIGGGFQAGGSAKVYYVELVGNQWKVYAHHHPMYSPDLSSSTTASYPICLKAEIVPKDPNAPTLTNGGP